MLRTGKEHLETLRDGRKVYIGSEKVDDVTRHPAFRGAAETVARIYDMKADPSNRDTMTYEEEGGGIRSISCGRRAATTCRSACRGISGSQTSPSACLGARPITWRRSSPAWR